MFRELSEPSVPSECRALEQAKLALGTAHCAALSEFRLSQG